MAARASSDGQRMRPPPLQTSLPRPSTAPHSEKPQFQRYHTPPHLENTPEETGTKEQPTHQRFVLSDPVAFRYLQEDPSTTVLEQRKELQGYECYVVEQWTTSRTHPTFVITTYTGDPSHSVVVGVLSVPTDESAWSPRLRVYFKALNHYHASRRQTALGILMVTNLSGFPSSLTVIPVPDGDLKKHRSDFFVNENLKRLGCSGRVGLTLTPPSAATVAKFHQLYRTSDKNPLYKSVVELVKLCQSALMLFGKLEIDFADGLLCDVTERAINDWWVEIGSDQYNVEPHDGILGPTTVSGLLGLLMGCRNRLHSVSAPVAKDAFDVEAMKRGISHFQKQQRMTRTRRLDRKTLLRLQDATKKAANSEGWLMPKAVKSTVAELSGKGGEMVMDVVSRRDRAGIAEIETCDMDRFVQLAYGERCKWLWHGKAPKKTRVSGGANAQDSGDANKGLVFKPDERGGFTWTARKSMAEGMSAEKNDEYNDLGSPDEEADQDDPRNYSQLKRTGTGLKNETRSGINKLKGAVGFKGHAPKPSADLSPSSPVDDPTHSKRPLFRRAQTSPVSNANSPTSPTQRQRRDLALGERKNRVSTDPDQAKWADFQAPFLTAPDSNQMSETSPRASLTINERLADGSPIKRNSDQPSGSYSATGTADPSTAGSVENGDEPNDSPPNGKESVVDVGPLLRQSASFSHFIAQKLENHTDDSYPRHLSFSLAEGSVLTWTGLTEDGGSESYNDFGIQLAEQNYLAQEARMLDQAITKVSSSTASWTQAQLRSLNTLLQGADHEQQSLDADYGPRLESANSMQASSEAFMREQKEYFEEASKEIETMAAKLEYEIGGLRSRVEDVEAGVGDFEKGVKRVEDRVTELEKQGNREGGWGCVMS